MAKDEEHISVEVVYGVPQHQKIISLQVPAGSTVFEAAMQSGIVNYFPEINLEKVPMGIFGQKEPRPKTRVLKAGERVEIYRELVADPKVIRQRRAEKIKAKKQAEADSKK